MSKRRLYTGQPAATATTVIAAGSSTRVIDAAAVCNPTAGAVVLSVHLVPSGDTVADDVIVYHEKSIAAGATETLSALVNQALEPGDTLSMTAGAATSLTVTISGRIA